MNQRDATVTQLSLKGLFSLLEEGKKGLIVQIIESEMISNQRAESKSLKFKYLNIFSLFLISFRVSISDGYTKSKAVLASDAATLFENAGNAENAVVRVLDLMQPNAQTSKR